MAAVRGWGGVHRRRVTKPCVCEQERTKSHENKQYFQELPSLSLH